MANNGIRGITIDIEGNTTGLTNALRDVDRATAVTAQELRQIEQGLRFNPESTELLAQRQEVLASQIQNTTQRLDTLRAAQEQVNAQFERGDISAEQYRSFNREIERTEGILRNLQQRASQGVEVQTDVRAIDRLNNAIAEIPNAARQASSAASTAITGIGAAATAAGAAIIGITAGMQETNTDIAILNTQLGQVGLSLDQVSAATTNFSVVGQQTDQIAEAFGNLVAAGYTTADQIDVISQNIAGAIIRYGDTFNAEGIGESIALTTELNEASGQLLDLLEREGINIDTFNAKIATFGTEAEKAQFITDTLANQGLADLNAAFQTGNPALVAQAEAQQQLTQALSELSVTLTPLLTELTEFANIILDVVNGNLELGEALEQLSQRANDVFPDLVEGAEEFFTGLLEGIAGAIPELVSFVEDAIPQIREGLRNNEGELLEAGGELIGNLLEGIADVLPDIISLGPEIIAFLVDTITDNLDSILEVGSNVIGSLLSGIVEAIPNILSAAVSIISSLVGGIVQNIPTIVNIGIEILQNLIEGLILAVGGIGKFVVTELIPQFVNNISNYNFTQVGQDIVQGLINGITSFTGNAINAITGVVNGVIEKARSLLGIRSPSRVFRAIGEFTSQGMADGIRRELPTVQGAAGELAGVLIDTVEANFRELERMETEQAAKLAEIETNKAQKIREIQLKANESKKGLTSAQSRQIEKLEADAAKKVLEINQSYAQQQIEVQQSLDAAKLKSVQDYIAQKRQLEQLSLVEEARLLELSLNAFSNDSEAKIEAQIAYRDALESVYDEISKINERYSDRITEINENLIAEEERLTKTYTDAIDDRANSLTNFTGLFEEFDATTEQTGADLLKNLRSQVDGLRTWESEFTKLSERAIDRGLLDELRKIGPEALGQLQQLNKFTDDQLAEYGELYRQRAETARELAIQELEPLREETQNNIRKLRVIAGQELDKLNTTWQEEIRAITEGTDDQLSSLEQVGRDAVRGLIVGLESESGFLEQKVREIVGSIEETTREVLQTRSPSRIMIGIGQDVGDGLIIGLQNRGQAVTDETRELVQRITDGFANSSSVNIDDLISLGADNATKRLAELNNQIAQYNETISLSGVETISFENRRKEIESEYQLLTERINSFRESLTKDIQGPISNETANGIENLIALGFSGELAEYQLQLQELNSDEKEYAEQFQDIQEAKFKAQKEFVDLSISLNNLSLRDQAELYNEFAQQYSQDSEQFKYFADQKLAVQKKLTDAVSKINTDFTAKIKKANDDLIANTQKVEQRYTDAFNGIRDSVLSATSGFGAFQRGEIIQGQTLIDNLQSQIRGINEFNSVVNSLSGRVDDTGFQEFIRSLGPESLAELEAINSLSKDELDQYVELYNERFKRASDVATISLQGLRQDVDAEIVALQSETATQLQAYELEWSNAISNITGNVESQFSDLPKTLEQTGRDIIQSISDGLSNTLPSLNAQLQQIANSISSTINSALDLNLDFASIQASTQRLANVATTTTGSLASSANRSTQAQQVNQNIINQQSQDNQALVDAVLKLVESPIMTNVSLDGRTIAQAVSGYQYQTAATNAITRGVIL